MKKRTQKRALVGGTALLLIAGVATGGALITNETIVAGNSFTTQFADKAPQPIDGEKLQIVNSPGGFDFKIDAFQDGEKQVRVQSLMLASRDFDAEVELRSVKVGGAPLPDALLNSLNAEVEGKGGEFLYSGKLSGLARSKAFTVRGGASPYSVQVAVSVPDAEALKAALGYKDSSATLDFQFHHHYIAK